MRKALAICGAVMPSAPRADAKSSFVCFILAPIVADLPHEEMLGIFLMSKCWVFSSCRKHAARLWPLAPTGYGHPALRVNNVFWLDGKISGRIVLPKRITDHGAKSYYIVY
jgi:hypothetical protein